MKRFKYLFITLALIVASSLATGETRDIRTSSKNLFREPNIYNVRDYGAHADADLASGYTAGSYVVATTPGQVADETDNAVAFTAASDAACASGRPATVYIPAGDYRFDSTSDTGFKPGWRVDLADCDLTIQGEGRDNTRLLPGGTGGQYIISACADHGARTTTCKLDTGTAAQSTNLTVRDLTFFDDDPVRHGYTLHILDVTGYAAGTPAVGQRVTWDGTETGTIEYVDLPTIHVREDALQTDPVDTNSITDGVWTDASLTVVSVAKGEESHGIHYMAVNNILIQNVACVNIGDECLDGAKFDTYKNENVRIFDSYAYNTPSIPGGGSFINIEATDGAMIRGNLSVGVVRSYQSAMSGLSLATNSSLSSSDIQVVGNRFVGPARGQIHLAPNNATLSDIVIFGNQIECTSTKFTATDSASTVTQSYAIGRTGTYTVDHVVIEGNTITGGFSTTSPEVFLCNDQCRIVGNTVDDTLSDPNNSLALSLSSDDVLIEGNHFFGGDGGFLLVVEPATNIVVKNNKIETSNDTDEEPTISIFAATDGKCLVDGLRVIDNYFDIAGYTNTIFKGGSCANHIARGNTIILNDGDGSSIFPLNSVNAIGNLIEAWTPISTAIQVTSSHTSGNGSPGIIRDNTIRLSDFNDDGILLATGAVGWLVEGNRIEGGFGGTSKAIQENSGADFNRIAFNYSSALYSYGPDTFHTFEGDTDVDFADPDGVTVTSHGFSHGAGPITLTGGVAPTGLALTTEYWINRVDDDTITFFATATDARDGTDPIDITADGSGTITINVVGAPFACAAAVESPDIGCDGNGGANSIGFGNIQRQ